MSFLNSYQRSLVDRIGASVHGVEARMMLGTIGLYDDAASDQPFGLMEGETFYLLADEEARDVFESGGATPVQAGNPGPGKSFFRVPAEVKQSDELETWVTHAIRAAS
jgi:TfoX/Sxy family transcriptional regulator of competence genes